LHCGKGGVNVDDVMWYNIKIMVFFIVPLGNLMALLLWRRRWFYEYKDYPGEGRHYWQRSYERNEKKRKKHNRFWLIFFLGSWNLMMLVFILYIIYR